VAYILPQQSGGKLRPVSEPAPTISTAGALALIVEYYGNGKTRAVSEPLPTVTCRDRFALIQQRGGDILFRMLRWRELAGAQGFRPDYAFAGNGTQITKQIGNAVPRRLARALCAAVLSQNSNVTNLSHAA
jgi:DNA (cytosine-5)-methyltransferase 1